MGGNLLILGGTFLKKRYIIVSVCFVLIISVLFNNDVRRFYHEHDYKTENDTESLARLCLEFIGTDNYEKQVLYYSKVLEREFFMKIIEKYDLLEETKYMVRNYDVIYYEEPNQDDEIISLAHHIILFEYQVALLKTHKYDTYLEQFKDITDEYSYKRYIFTDLQPIILDEEVKENQLSTVLNALKNQDFSDGQDDYLMIGNLTTQSIIQRELGNDVEADRLLDDIAQVQENLLNGEANE